MYMFVLESHLFVHGIVFFAWEMSGINYSFSMSFSGCGLRRHVVWMSGDRWPMRWKMVSTIRGCLLLVWPIDQPCHF